MSVVIYFPSKFYEQVGLGSDYSYARSLAQYSAGLGPVAWKIVSNKIRSVLPPGVEFGPGWVDEPKGSSTQLTPLPEMLLQLNCVSQDSLKSEPHHLSTSCPEKLVESREISSNVEWSSVRANGVVGSGASPSLQIQPQGSVHPRMNGFNDGFASGSHFQEPMARPTSSSSLFNPHTLDSSSFDASRSFHGVTNPENDMVTSHGMPYWRNLSVQERWDHSYPVELNSGFQASGSKSSSLPIGSPPQLDLVLQL